MQERNAESLTSSTKTVNDVPVTVPQTGWKAFPSQDFRYSAMAMCIVMLLNLCGLCQGRKIVTGRTKTKNLLAEFDS